MITTAISFLLLPPPLLLYYLPSGENVVVEESYRLAIFAWESGKLNYPHNCHTTIITKSIKISTSS